MYFFRFQMTPFKSLQTASNERILHQDFVMFLYLLLKEITFLRTVSALLPLETKQPLSEVKVKPFFFFFFLVRSLKPQKFQHFPCSVASTTWDHYICSSSRPNQPFRPELAFPFLSDVQLFSVLCVANVTLSHLTRLSLRAPALLLRSCQKGHFMHVILVPWRPNLWHRDLTTCKKWHHFEYFLHNTKLLLDLNCRLCPGKIHAVMNSRTETLIFFILKDCLWVDHACESWL